MKQNISRVVLMTCTVVSLTASAEAQTLKAYLSAPASQTSVFTSVTVETFEGFTTGKHTSLSSTIGQYKVSGNGTASIQVNDQYGTGTGKYLAFGAQSNSSDPITLTFNTPQSYFGFSWNAGDANNGIAFYNGSNLLAHYKTSLLLDLLKNPTVQSYDGSQTYQSSKYFGQPGTGQNSGEPYGFVNFIETGGTFTSIVFDNSGTTGSGFESDNHTILTSGVATPQSSFVLAGTAVIGGGSTTFTAASPFASTPEPNACVTFEAGSLLLIGALLRGRVRTLGRSHKKLS